MVSIWMSHFDSKFWAKSQIIVEIFDNNFQLNLSLMKMCQPHLVTEDKSTKFKKWKFRFNFWELINDKWDTKGIQDLR
jgi:hypothetical protein